MFSQQCSLVCLGFKVFGFSRTKAAQGLTFSSSETEITLEKILSFACQIAEACYYLHYNNYIHGWLAAHNILIVNEEEVKLSDVSVPCLREEDMLCETVNINR